MYYAPFLESLHEGISLTALMHVVNLSVCKEALGKLMGNDAKGFLSLFCGGIVS